jgi:hypothetical protein
MGSKAELDHPPLPRGFNERQRNPGDDRSSPGSDDV